MDGAEIVERRRAARWNISLPVVILVESDRRNMHQAAVVCDVSQFGARVRGHIGLAPGNSTDMILRDQGRAHVVPARVVWLDRIAPNGMCEAGLSFPDPSALPAAVIPGVRPS